MINYKNNKMIIYQQELKLYRENYKIKKQLFNKK